MLGMPLEDPINTGFNYGSPTVNYVMGGMNSIPPNPIGNTLNIGGQGYNNYNPAAYQQQAYYNQYGQMQYSQPMYNNQSIPQQSYNNNPYTQQPIAGYNSYYSQPQAQGYNSYYGGYNYLMNPYLMQQQQKAAEAAYKEQIRQESDIFKTVSRIVHKSIGDIDEYEDFDKFLTQYDPVEVQQEDREEELKYNKLANLVPNQSGDYYIQNCAKISENYKKDYPDSMGLFDFLNNAGTLYRNAVIEQTNAINRNAKLQYDTDSYKKILESHRSSSSYFNSLLTGGTPSSKITVDDMEIELPSSPGDSTKIVVNCPSHLKEYASRKQAFLDNIMKNATKF